MTDNLSQTYEQSCSDTSESPHLPQPSITSLLTNQLLEKIVKEVRKKENMDKIHGSIIDPLIQYTYNKIYPYILILFGVLILIFLIIVVILLLILRPRFFNRIR
jgi:hypothetical protein